MTYDLDIINQAWYIACEECMENVPADISDADMLTHIAAYIRRFAESLVNDAAIEVNERQVKAIKGNA